MVGFRNRNNFGLFRSQFSKVSPYTTLHEPMHEVYRPIILNTLV